MTYSISHHMILQKLHQINEAFGFGGFGAWRMRQLDWWEIMCSPCPTHKTQIPSIDCSERHNSSPKGIQQIFFVLQERHNWYKHRKWFWVHLNDFNSVHINISLEWRKKWVRSHESTPCSRSNLDLFLAYESCEMFIFRWKKNMI